MHALKTGEILDLDDRSVSVYNIKTLFVGETVYDALMTAAARFKTLAVELENMALARKP